MPVISMMRKSFSIVGLPVINYIIGFIVLPFSVLKVTNEKCAVIVFILWLIISTCYGFKHLKLRYILLECIPIWLLILVYCPNGLYGIGSDGILDFSPKELDALFISVGISLFQTFMFVICKTYRYICLKMSNSTQSE